MLKIRIIKSDNCPRCKTYLDRLDKLQCEYETYNVDNASDSEKAELDKWGIIDMPVVQLVDQNNIVQYQFPFVERGWSPRSIRHKIQELS